MKPETKRLLAKEGRILGYVTLSVMAYTGCCTLAQCYSESILANLIIDGVVSITVGPLLYLGLWIPRSIILAARTVLSKRTTEAPKSAKAS